MIRFAALLTALSFAPAVTAYADGEYYGEGGYIPPEVVISSEDVAIAEPSRTEGNMILVDEAADKDGSHRLFYTVETRGGNTFYIIIDRDYLGRENVHFLNQVDDADLLRILDEEDTETLPETTAVEAPEPMYTEASEQPEETIQVIQENDSGSKSSAPKSIIIVLLIIAVIGGGYALWRFKLKDGKSANDSFDDEYDGDGDDK